ncbi:MAG: nucleoside-diphosphate-sugar epimerase [Rhodospirillaceae bacterium]|nr:nucleoside-diphosphate-sugar epimerase [Rhodospirillaceae bacterium]
MRKRVYFTGASGKAGKHAANYLIQKGHRVLNADITKVNQEGLDYLKVDVTDSAQVFSSMSAHMDRNELRQRQTPLGYDAVVHFAAIPRILQASDIETYKVNVMGTYNVLEAAVKLGIKKIIFASSETVYGLCFSHDKPAPLSLPILEEDETRPMDSYAMSKVVNEETAKAFQRRTGTDIYGLRIGNVVEPDEYDLFEDFCNNPKVRLPNAFNYIDARDLGQAVDLCISKDGLGYEVFNVSNDQNSVNLTTEDIRKRFYPEVPLKRDIHPYECLFSNEKIKNLLGFAPQHDWREQT